MENPKLKYLFEAYFADGSFYVQTPEDTSLLDEKRNCYYDVLQSGKTIRRFSLVSIDHKFTVDLSTGLFEVDGFSLLLESEKLPCLPEKFELVYYHQVTRDQNVTYDKSTGEVVKRENLPEFREYFIGWKCFIKSKEYQVRMGVA